MRQELFVCLRLHDHLAERDSLTENEIRLAYADRLAVAFEALLMTDMTTALQAGSRQRRNARQSAVRANLPRRA